MSSSLLNLALPLLPLLFNVSAISPGTAGTTPRPPSLTLPSLSGGSALPPLLPPSPISLEAAASGSSPSARPATGEVQRGGRPAAAVAPGFEAHIIGMLDEIGRSAKFKQRMHQVRTWAKNTEPLWPLGLAKTGEFPDVPSQMAWWCCSMFQKGRGPLQEGSCVPLELAQTAHHTLLHIFAPRQAQGQPFRRVGGRHPQRPWASCEREPHVSRAAAVVARSVRQGSLLSLAQSVRPARQLRARGRRG